LKKEMHGVLLQQVVGLGITWYIGNLWVKDQGKQKKKKERFF